MLIVNYWSYIISLRVAPYWIALSSLLPEQPNKSVQTNDHLMSWQIPYFQHLRCVFIDDLFVLVHILIGLTQTPRGSDFLSANPTKANEAQSDGQVIAYGEVFTSATESESKRYIPARAGQSIHKRLRLPFPYPFATLLPSLFPLGSYALYGSLLFSGWVRTIWPSSSRHFHIRSAPDQQTPNNTSLVCRTWQRTSNVGAPRPIRWKTRKLEYPKNVEQIV